MITRYVYVSIIDVTDKLFFAIFGQNEAADFMISWKKNIQPPWIVNIIKVSFSVYMLVSVIVLINLLIAMMSDTYQRIVSQSDIEWKYGLSKLVRSVQRARTPPMPLNLFSTWISWLNNTYKARKEKRKKDRDKESLLSQHGYSNNQGLHLENGRAGGKPSSAGSAFTFAIVPGINTIVDWAVVRKKYRMLFGDEPEKP
ncbi:short transient receptor potential channel 3-like [Venturia canescens]|uniref:short transient receptor potential channel 3-like n=1 Tax=Venturia canescens TaxID=32260 RepID=UPI001C9D2B97|nr:short transient receptor potential channel 3-like [Venturia canescens]